jgi:hypothetical protein
LDSTDLFPKMSASSSRENFKWSEEMAYKLAKLVLRHKGYKRTELTMKDKWSSILSELKRDEVFHDLNISWESLQNAFRRNCEKVLKDAGISEEGANLSGLPEQPSDYQTLVINMAEEVAKEKDKSKRAAAKRKFEQEVMKSHEMASLKK